MFSFESYSQNQNTLVLLSFAFLMTLLSPSDVTDGRGLYPEKGSDLLRCHHVQTGSGIRSSWQSTGLVAKLFCMEERGWGVKSRGAEFLVLDLYTSILIHRPVSIHNSPLKYFLIQYELQAKTNATRFTILMRVCLFNDAMSTGNLTQRTGYGA